MKTSKRKKDLTIDIDRGTFIPRYYQLKEILKKRITSGHYKPEQKLPSEPELIMATGLSKATVAKAIRSLIEEGVAYSQLGRGTFVSSPAGKTAVKTGKLAFIISLNDKFVNEILAGVESSAQEKQCSVNILNSKGYINTEDRLVHEAVRQGVDGIIIWPAAGVPESRIRLRYAEYMKKNNVPFCLVDRYFPGIDTNYVVSDNTRGTYEATKYLVSRGKRRIIYVLAINCSSVRDRFTGYKQALAETGIPFDKKLVVQVTPDDKLPLDEIRTLLSNTKEPTAVFLHYDIFGKEILELAGKLGLSVPEDLAVIAYDSDYAPYFNIPLTSVVQQRFEMGLKASAITLGNTRSKNTKVLLPPKLVVRSST